MDENQLSVELDAVTRCRSAKRPVRVLRRYGIVATKIESTPW